METLLMLHPGDSDRRWLAGRGRRVRRRQGSAGNRGPLLFRHLEVREGRSMLFIGVARGFACLLVGGSRKLLAFD
jgi:hypothetical protein